jgi:hypothetical protein
VLRVLVGTVLVPNPVGGTQPQTFTITGVYEGLLEDRCGHVIGDGHGWCGLDPRGNPEFRSGGGPSDDDVAVWSWLEAECGWLAEQDKAERLKAGEPFEVRRYMIGGNHFPLPRDHPLRARDVKRILFADDMVQPIHSD